MTFDSLQQAVIAGEAEETVRLVQQHLDEGADALDILDNGLIAAMDKVGAMFSAGDLFIPEMLVSAEAMQEGLGLLKPLLLGRVSGGKGTVVMGAVKGDLHDIGKNLVVLMLEGAGFTVVDLGNDVAPEAFVAAAKEHEAVVVGMSALLVTTMPQMKITVEPAARRRPRRQGDRRGRPADPGLRRRDRRRRLRLRRPRGRGPLQEHSGLRATREEDRRRDDVR